MFSWHGMSARLWEWNVTQHSSTRKLRAFLKRNIQDFMSAGMASSTPRRSPVPDSVMERNDIMEKVRFGIIGSGMIAAIHAQAIQSLDNAELVGFYDQNHAAAEKRAGEFHCRAYDSFEEFLADASI